MALPPTTNSLDASQRARLLKSTRKLTDVLGATPHLLDTDLLLLPSPSPTRNIITPVRQKRQGIQLYSSPNDSSSSFVSLLETADSAADYRQGSAVLKQRRRRKSMIDRPLVLCLHPLNSPTYAIRLSIASIASPLSPLPSSAASSTTEETFPDNAESTIRRKRMLKLTRTLGENVPSELLLSQCSRGDEQQRHVRQKIAADDSDSAPLPTTKKERRRSASLLVPTTTPFPVRTTSLARSASTTVQKTQRHQHHHHRRAESEWNGEWNIEDAEKRAQALRNLRCR